ncbi:MAG: Asp23/Gls24 family envelope stress response protein [Candidatus Omnitrophica bacterium]|jgi:uncharacterized alkaline shock family protein YloU|nr:Asp23/Gls24 family envelope stress response protein [Candidatus Omnitrophota bacterium]
MKQEERSDLGMVKIHRNVVASIASLAAQDIEGVKRVGFIRMGFMEFLTSKAASCIKVEFEKNEDVKVQIPLVVKYDYNIADVSSKVQENVRSSLERMTSLFIKEISINVQGVERG